MQTPIILFRFIITFIFPLLFGLERQKSHKPVGFGTFTFVSIGSCGLAITAISLYPENPLPLLSAIVTGIGFLGAGALIKTADKIYGITTAAGIWVFAIFGLIVGTGQYLVAFTLYALIWMVILFDKYLEYRGIGSYRRKLIINTDELITFQELDKILLSGLEKYHLLLTEVSKKDKSCSFHYTVEGSKHQMNNTFKSLLEKAWCQSIKVE